MVVHVVVPLLAALLVGAPVLAQEPHNQGAHAGHKPPAPATENADPPPPEHASHAETANADQMPADMKMPQDASQPSSQAASKGDMQMGSMQGGRAPPDARDPHAYAEGYEYTGMAGMETSDQIRFGWLAADEFEYLSGNEGDGYAWNLQANYGDDRNKLWVRTQGLKVPGELDPTTGGEILWWRPHSAFWGTQLGLRQDFGDGAHTYLAAGVEGIAPYWFIVEATGYVGEGGRLAARVKLSYDVRFSNRLILTPNLEANAYSKSDDERDLGAGLGNIELGFRLRYEIRRKFAPYAGYVWERSFSGTADRRRAAGDPVSEHRFVAGFRMWF